jgi:DNA-binding MarR family transcriptional regulator
LNSPATAPLAADPRLILRPEELDAALEQFLLAEAALWIAADPALEDEPHKLGRGHFRAAFLLKRRPGLGVKDLVRLTGLSKQGASRVLKDLIEAGYAKAAPNDQDARRRPTMLTDAGAAFEARVAERMRAHLSAAFRDGGLDAVLGARRIMAAVAGPRAVRRIGADL